jgi:hypothetical protein
MSVARLQTLGAAMKLFFVKAKSFRSDGQD